VVLLLLATPIDAQDQAGSPARQTARQAVALPDAEKVTLLIRTSLLTLNDAIQTGNFTVLRDKSAPSFQAANSAAKLSIAFQDLAEQHIDLARVALLAPQLTQAPVIDTRNRLQLAGYFAPGAIRIDFDLVFEAVGGRWRLFGISVNPAQAAANADTTSGLTDAATTPASAATGALSKRPNETPRLGTN